MSILNRTLLVAAVVAVAGCKVELAVPAGGAVSTEFGTYRVEAGQSDSIEVDDLAFHETFTAEPAAGHLFAGWQKQERGLCGGSLEPCELYTSWMAGEDSLIAILESDESFYLTPSFLPSDQIRLYAAGDTVSFSGTLVDQQEFEAKVTTDVTARIEIVPATYTLAGKNVMAAQLTVLDLQGNEIMVRTTHYWQEAGGAFYDLTDDYGNYYRDAATNQSGLASIPAPLVPLSSSELQFNTLSASAPLTEGTRTVEVGEAQAVSVPLASVSAYPVTISDSSSYLSAFGEFRRGEVVESEQLLWVSQVKGVIKSSVVQRRYSNIGKLQSTTTLELKAIGANF
ncbi:MAG: hypothetical protein V7720_04560 [Halioglobus sp.]